MLPDAGAVLGIDVGFSATRRSTCFCLLRWTGGAAHLAFRSATADPAMRRDALTDLLAGVPRVLAVAVDGPLVPGLAHTTRYRAAEALLSRGPMQRRGKPGATSAPVGQRLHRHATELAHLALGAVEVAPAAHADAIHERCVVEAFPNAFLAALLDDDEFPPLRRDASDVFWELAVDRVGCLLEALLPRRALDVTLPAVRDHDDRAGVVCTLTALAVASGAFVAVGDPAGGEIILPPLGRWGQDRAGTPWLLGVLRDAAAALGGPRPGRPTFTGARVREVGPR